jgi:hypothetical protein
VQVSSIEPPGGDFYAAIIKLKRLYPYSMIDKALVCTRVSLLYKGFIAVQRSPYQYFAWV